MRPFGLAATLSGVALLVGACGGNDSFSSSEDQVQPPNLAVNGQAEFEEFEICKVGSAATFDYAVTDRTTSAVTNGQVTLQDGDCYVVALAGGIGADVTVTENVPSGYQLDKVEIDVLTSGPTHTPRTESGPTVSDFVRGGGASSRGVLATFYNSEIPETPSTGRMTGGGKQIEVGGVAITRGFTVHCDITLSNNIEINWANNKWHLDKPIDTAQCFDDPNIDQKPPKAPLDTFIGTATGRLNGVDGSTLEFTFVDAGEPGRNDLAALRIRDENGGIVLDVPLSNLTNGNIQAHADQPHNK